VTTLEIYLLAASVVVTALCWLYAQWIIRPQSGHDHIEIIGLAAP